MVAGIVIPRISALSIEVDMPRNVFILGCARFALISPRFVLKGKALNSYQIRELGVLILVRLKLPYFFIFYYFL